MAWVGLAYAGGKATYDAIEADQARLHDGAEDRKAAGQDYLNKRRDWASAAYDTSEGDAFQGDLTNRLKAVGARQAPQASYTGGATPAWAGQTHINTAQSDASRAQQMAAYNMLAAQAAGKGPSVATQQMKANVDAANAANMAFAASARGHVNPMLAARQAAMSNASNLQAGARDSAMLRTQEQLAGQNAMWQAAYGMHGQDLQSAQAQAQLNQQTALANAGFQQQSGMFNADAQQKVELANLEAKLRSQGMNDAAISQYLAMRQNEMQYEKQAKLDFHAHRAAGDMSAQQFYANLNQQKSMYDQNRKDAQYAAVGQGVGSLVSYYNSQPSGGGGGGGAPSGADSLASYYDKSGF